MQFSKRKFLEVSIEMELYDNIQNGSEEENQTTEWKWSWSDDFLKWLCGYANVDGGTLYVGVNDDGYVVGLEEPRKLLESLPNKINDKLGIVASIRIHHAERQGTNIKYGDNIPADIANKLVNKYVAGIMNSYTIEKSKDIELNKYEKAILKLEAENPVYVNLDGTLDYIGITIDKYPFAISCEGKYYKRSGSTLRELQGFELQNFLLERAGKTWDSVPVPGVSLSDLDRNALNAFRSKAVENKRMSKSDVEVSDDLLLRNLKLYDGEYLTRAAVLLFHPDPEQYVTGAYLKVAFFAPAGTYGMNEDADIIYQDDIHGPLITQADKVVDIIYTKYFKALISYEQLQRIETYMLSVGMIRELILNPINHKEYSKGVPIQISVFEDHIEIFNVGLWPASIPLDDTLYQRHESIPYNPKIADVFYRAGEIESWGRGFLKVRHECEKIDAALPIIKRTESGITVKAFACRKYIQVLSANRIKDRNKATEGRDFQTDMILNVDGTTILVEPKNRTAPMIEKVQNKRKAVYEHMVEVCSENLKESEKKRIYPIVEYFKTHDQIDRSTAEKICGRATTTTVGYLNKLVSLGVLKKVKGSVATVYRMADYIY